MDQPNKWATCTTEKIYGYGNFDVVTCQQANLTLSPHNKTQSMGSNFHECSFPSLSPLKKNSLLCSKARM